MITSQINTNYGRLIVDLLATVFPLVLFLSLVLYLRFVRFTKNENLVSNT